jgi:hypothetical protein
MDSLPEPDRREVSEGVAGAPADGLRGECGVVAGAVYLAAQRGEVGLAEEPGPDSRTLDIAPVSQQFEFVGYGQDGERGRGMAGRDEVAAGLECRVGGLDEDLFGGLVEVDDDVDVRGVGGAVLDLGMSGHGIGSSRVIRPLRGDASTGI